MSVVAFTEAVDSFAATLALERGLADRTQEAYLRDVRALVLFLERRGVRDAGGVSRNDVVSYLDVLRRESKRPSSRARAFTSIKEFFSHLKEAKLISANPAEGLEAPKKGLTLPKILPEE